MGYRKDFQTYVSATDAKLSPPCDEEEEEEEIVDVSGDSPLLRGKELAEGEGSGVNHW
jgi:hypothetical protein